MQIVFSLLILSQLAFAKSEYITLGEREITSWNFPTKTIQCSLTGYSDRTVKFSWVKTAKGWKCVGTERGSAFPYCYVSFDASYTTELTTTKTSAPLTLTKSFTEHTFQTPDSFFKGDEITEAEKNELIERCETKAKTLLQNNALSFSRYLTQVTKGEVLPNNSYYDRFCYKQELELLVEDGKVLTMDTSRQVIVPCP